MSLVNSEQPWYSPTSLGKSQDINKLLKVGDPVSAAIFSYWGIVRDILKDADKGGESARLLAIAGDFLQASQLPSRWSESKKEEPESKKEEPLSPCPSIAIDIPEDGENPSFRALSSSETHNKPRNPKAIYPSLKRDLRQEKASLRRPSESGLDSTSEVDLEEESAKYEEERYGPEPQMSQVFLTQKDGPIFPPPYLPPFPSVPTSPCLCWQQWWKDSLRPRRHCRLKLLALNKSYIYSKNWEISL